MAAENIAPDVGLIMGSDSDWKTMRKTAETLDKLGIKCESKVISAHRTPVEMFKYAEEAESRGLNLIIAAAGGAAHLPGMTASKTIVPIIGVPVIATPLNGLDAFLSIMQMPAEVGVATVNIGEKGALHAALFAGTILARKDDAIYSRLRDMREDMFTEAQPAKKKEHFGARPHVEILVECESHEAIMKHSEETLRKLDIPFTMRRVDPTTSLEDLAHLTRQAEEQGACAVIVSCGHGVDLPGKIARTTLLPVLGVPVVTEPIDSIDRYLEPFLKMPSGMATFAIGRPGAINAALFAATILSVPMSPDIRSRLRGRRKEQVDRVKQMTLPA